MKKASLAQFSVDHPRLVVILAVLVTIGFATQLPRMTTDTNPKNMLPPTSDVRVWNDEVEKTFGLYEDMIVVGIVNDQGILNRGTLGKVARITDEILGIEGVADRDVNSFTTITNVTAREGVLQVGPLMGRAPQTDVEIEELRKSLQSNPLLLDRVISRDGRTTAIYVPLEKGANGRDIAIRLMEIVDREGGPEQYHIAGDPVARDTFGADMFRLMALFSPVAGASMFIAIYLMFRSLSLAASMMAVAMISTVWSMGLLVALGFPVHIMSSMSPVFLMAIATDSIHIFNEYYFRFRERKDRRIAILETMEAVSRPVRYTALATAAGFAVLLFMEIIPVKVFGGLVAFGTVVLRLLSFSFIPAILTFIRAEKIEKAAARELAGPGRTAGILRSMGALGASRPRTVALAGLAIVAVGVVGTTMIRVNNNMVEWFKSGSEVRTADRVMNEALGGTSLGYVVAVSDEAEYLKSPEAMRYLESLQRHIEKLPVVGKTVSVVDIVKRVNSVLHDEDPRFDAVPASREEIGQYLFMFSMSARPSDLDNLVDYPFQKGNIWVQLKTWDAEAMRIVISATEEFKRNNPSPMELRPAGIAYFNLVWNDEVLYDMLKGFFLALVVVFGILAVNFRSVKWAVVGSIPLLFTIVLIYGAVGFLGKDFDMPMSVLSCLSLGMAVDFAIHFIGRFRQRLADGEYPGEPHGNGQARRGTDRLTSALLWTAERPGKGIMRNALLFAAAFSVMIFAPLTPYITVGMFIVSMMLLSSVLTIIYLPAIIMLLRRWLFPQPSITSNFTIGAPMKAALWLALALALPAAGISQPAAGEIMKQSQAAFLYAGKDFKARVMMTLTGSGGQQRVREMTMLRKNFGEAGGRQKYFMYFFQPADVRDMTFMVEKFPAKDDDRWLYVPAISMVRRIAAQDKNSSFVGSDFTYEDVSGRDLEDDTHTLVREEKLGTAECYVVKSEPKSEDAGIGHKLSWVDKTHFLPMKEEYYDRKGGLYRVFAAEEVATVKGYPTITKRSMKNVQSGHSTQVVFTKIDYDINIEDNLFSERYLRQPPKKWTE